MNEHPSHQNPAKSSSCFAPSNEAALAAGGAPTWLFWRRRGLHSLSVTDPRRLGSFYLMKYAAKNRCGRLLVQMARKQKAIGSRLHLSNVAVLH
jgi:hypothetical protein